MKLVVSQAFLLVLIWLAPKNSAMVMKPTSQLAFPLCLRSTIIGTWSHFLPFFVFWMIELLEMNLMRSLKIFQKGLQIYGREEWAAAGSHTTYRGKYGWIVIGFWNLRVFLIGKMMISLLLGQLESSEVNTSSLARLGLAFVSCTLRDPRVQRQSKRRRT